MTANTRVKYSQAALRPLWDRYLAQGDYTQKNLAKRHWQEKSDLRGTITAVEAGGNVLVVRWDNDTISRLLPYIVKEVNRL